MRPLSRIFQKRYVFHLLFWIMYAVFMLMDMQAYIIRKDGAFNVTPMLLSALIMAVLVYGNTLVLIPMLLEKKRIFWYTLSILVLIVANTLVRSQFQRYFDSIVWPDEPMALSDYFHWNLFYTLWFIVIATMLYYSQKWSEQQQKVKNIEINQLKSELKYLRSQLNPHFLFNGLNTIYGNIDIRDQKARNTLLQFSDLLRYSLYDADTDFVDLGKEVKHLNDYVALQKARSNENLKIETDVRIEDPAAQIAPLIFLPFVENAFKFCTRDDNKNNYIRISLIQGGNQIRFTCINSFEENPGEIGGIGITNAKRRLELLYKDRHNLNIRKEASEFFIELTLVL